MTITMPARMDCYTRAGEAVGSGVYAWPEALVSAIESMPAEAKVFVVNGQRVELEDGELRVVRSAAESPGGEA